VDSFANTQIFRADKRSTKGQRQSTTMQSIKRLLLLAAVLSFAAMNVAALNPDTYVVKQDEDGEYCKTIGFGNRRLCHACCITLSCVKAPEVYFMVENVFKNYEGLCVCENLKCQKCQKYHHYFTEQDYENAAKTLSGDVDWREIR
jgi:hypothetical protein